MKLNKFPLEIKLIIYEYFDPKNKMVNISRYIIQEMYIEIESEIVDHVIFGDNIIHFRCTGLYADQEQIFLRKSQVLDCYKRLK